MRLKLAANLLLPLVGCWVFPAFSANLSQIYQQAYQSSPSFKSDRALKEAAQDNVKVTFGDLLPQLSLTANASSISRRSNQHTADYSAWTYNATLSQTLFDANKFANARSSYDMAAAASDKFAFEHQQFMLEVARLYFAVLESQDNLRMAKSEANFLQNALRQSKQKLAVGLTTRADYLQALANYNQAVAQVLAANNNVANSKENLRELIGEPVPSLAPLSNTFPFAKPSPAKPDHWVKQALAHNYQLQAARQRAMAKLSSVYASAGNSAPKVSVAVSYNVDNFSSNVPASVSGEDKTINGAVNLQMTWNIFAGGARFAQTVQAAHNYAASDAQADNTYRQVEQQTRSDYSRVLSYRAKVSALKQSVKAGALSVQQFEAKYNVGVTTIVGVLNQLRRLYEDKRSLAQAEYDYIIAALALKADAASLRPKDFHTIDRWLQVQS